MKDIDHHGETMGAHRSDTSPLVVVSKSIRRGRRLPTGRRVAIKAHRPSLKQSVAAYALAAVLALGGGTMISKSFEADSVSASQTIAKMPDNAANFLQYLKTDEVPEAIQRPAEIAKEKLVADPVKPVNKPVTAPAVERQAPDHLVIPALGVSSLIVESPLENNALVIPSSGLVGEYTEGTPLIGTAGTTLIVGHVNFADGSMGALGPITYAKPGQIVNASDGTGKIHQYKIVKIETFVKRALPDEVFATTGPRRLVMVTCGGPIVEMPSGGMGYRDNIVVTAVPVE